MSKFLLPLDVKNALIQVCGRSFHYKQPLFDIFARAGIPENLYLKYEHEPKFKIARQLIDELEDMGEEGSLLQRRLLTELYKLRTLPDSGVLDRDAGLDALRALKRLTQEYDLIAKEDREQAKRRASDSEAKIQQIRERERRLKELYEDFIEMCSDPNHQARGYSLEDLLKELFALFDIDYRKSYRTTNEQIDGSFHFKGFDYLVEARWRKDVPTLDELVAFRDKVDRKMESTRGFFISVEGFREDINHRLHEGRKKLILMDGHGLHLILEGRVSLIDALETMVDKASQEGVLYFPLVNLFKNLS